MLWVGMSGIDIVVDVEAFEALPYWQTMSSLGVPPHVSILYPWRRSPLSMLDMTDVENVIDAVPAFSISFDAVARFENGTVYAQIGDSPALSALMRTVWKAFPETPPYGGEFAAPAPHVTLAKPPIEHADAVMAELRAKFAAGLPLGFDVSRISILEQLADDTWRTANEIELRTG